MNATTILSVWSWVTSNGPQILQAILMITGGLSVLDQFVSKIPVPLCQNLAKADEKFIAFVTSPVTALLKLLGGTPPTPPAA